MIEQGFNPQAEVSDTESNEVITIQNEHQLKEKSEINI